MSFLSIEPLLIDRLTERVKSARQVRSIADLDELSKGSEALPAIFVLPDRTRLGKVDGSLKKAKYEEDWIVVVMVKSARRGGNAPEALRESAGSLMLDVFQALAGWVPAPRIDALTPIDPPAMAINGGFGYFPLAFRTGYIVSAD